MHNYIIGIDTGGTFTDAVLLDASSNQVLQTAKVPTTHHQLSIGTGQVLSALLQTSKISASEINAVAVSSTLATNSVVENKGARVAVLVIGYVKHFKLPVKAVIFVKGGHTITGTEEEPLELDYLIPLLENLRNEVDAYGVCSAMSFKNQTHELVTEKAISMIDPKPVFCSHRISQKAGMRERAATAGLHAKLMPIMQEYITGVQSALDRQQISCPMHIVGGSGKPISSQEAIEHAGMTVASGPACTALFGSLQAENDALIIDVGGTTTDIVMVKNSIPLLAKEGCQIGGWKTHVEAIDMLTRGIGGDSHVHVDENKNLVIGPQRVTPVATADCTLDAAEWLGAGGNSRCINTVASNAKIPTTDVILDILKDSGPSTPAWLQKKTGLSGIPLEKQLENLSRKQLIHEIGFTPTDALHVLGKIEIGNSDTSRAAAAILGNICSMDADAFSAMVVQQTVILIENSVIEYVTSHYWQKSLTNFISSRNNHPVLGVEFSLKIPIIGIGAAAKFFLPQVAKRLKTTVQFPENYEVGNAIGAALTWASASQQDT
jgi:N-methylhydantoinase A/oxoprolinase/acetone carboxylase beta subunit